MPGLTIVVERLFEIAQSAQLASSAIREAAEEARTYKSEIGGAAATTSGMAPAGGGPSTMGSSDSGGTGAAGVTDGGRIATAMVTELQRRMLR